MRYEELRTEYFLFRKDKYSLGLRFNEAIFYFDNKEIKSWKTADGKDTYELTIKLINEKDAEKRSELDKQIKDSLIYKEFIKEIEKYSSKIVD